MVDWKKIRAKYLTTQIYHHAETVIIREDLKPSTLLLQYPYIAGHGQDSKTILLHGKIRIKFDYDDIIHNYSYITHIDLYRARGLDNRGLLVLVTLDYDQTTEIVIRIDR